MINYKLYSFTDDQFTRLSLNVHKLKERQNPLTRFPILQEFDEFMVKIPNIKTSVILKYIVYMYDYNSPLRIKIENIQLRKYNAMHMAGVDPNDENEYSEGINDILLNNNEAVLKMIFRYVRIHRGSKYGYLVSLQEGYFIAQEKLSQGQVANFDTIKRTQAEIEKVTTDLMAEDDMNKLQGKFLDYVEVERLGLRPEDIARAFYNKEDPLPGVSPYKRKKDERQDKTTEMISKHEEKLKVKYGLS
ncbi:MAG: hypothetical protein ACI9DM_000248 [Cyclobacteriaceae bacterium]|jgi:hypothetical protein